MFARQQLSSDSRAGRASVQLVSVQETVELARAIVGRGEENDRIVLGNGYGRPAEMAAGWRASISTKRAKSFSLKVRMCFTPCTRIAATRRAS